MTMVGVRFDKTVGEPVFPNPRKVSLENAGKGNQRQAASFCNIACAGA